MQLYINGIPTNAAVAAQIQSTMYGTSLPGNGVDIGNRNNTAGTTNFNAAFKGLIADVRIYNRVLSPTEITNIVGLAFAPPTISTPPQSLLRYTNDPAYFTVSANSSVAATYQWRLNGTKITNGLNIGGATSPALLLSNLLSSQAGSYTVVVSNAYGAVTSTPPAILEFERRFGGRGQ
jgi:hypothetical protein